MIAGENELFTVTRFKGGDDEVRADWLANRNTGIGGSDVAAVMGLSKYKGPYTLWAEKVGDIEAPDLSDKQAVEWGNRLEPVVGGKYSEMHPERNVRRVNGSCRSISRPWALASLDYEVFDPERGWGVLEIKTVGLRSAEDWDDGVPIYYQTQVQHYLDVTGRPYADVAVLIGGQEYREYRIDEDEADQAAIRKAVDDFWGLVVKRVPPAPSYGDQGAVFARHMDGSGMEDVLAQDVPELGKWLKLKEIAEADKKSLDRMANALKERIGDLDGIKTEAGRLKWVRSTSTSFDRKRFDEDYPGIYSRYCTVKPKDGGLRWTPAKKED